MALYVRKKNEPIDAEQWTADHIPRGICIENHEGRLGRRPQAHVHAGTGRLVSVELGNWIVKEPVEGCYYPIDSKTFEHLYEPKR